MTRNPFVILSTVLSWFFRAHSRLKIDPRHIHVIDGDTIRYQGHRYRLIGFDAPEIFSPASAHEHRQGIASRRTLSDLVTGATTAELTTYENDRYGRTLASLRLDGVDVATHITTQPV